MLVLISGILIGFTLGLMGAGGAILTVPVMMYAAGMEERQAIASALFIVATISATLSIRNLLNKAINWQLIGWFGLPGIVGAYLGAVAGNMVSTSVQMTVFALLMAVAATRMLWESAQSAPNEKTSIAAGTLFFVGMLTGLMTGFVGVGGGFLIVPALTLLAGISMTSAIATSLAVITLNASVGFYQYLHVFSQQGIELAWKTLVAVAAIGVLGSLIGNVLGRRLPQKHIKKIFAVFLLGLSFFTVIEQVGG
ncbi:hypothetical protein A8L45_19135 [Veronia pacifica]|uniref:Probable membrane transporter protein n=2 Tax=Veronia pacifica TaxID=1080227 RepID=A0A1C3EC77_9GAMM|nr:hypothetical protein A8L45_19135 [Veronia pacifica]